MNGELVRLLIVYYNQLATIKGEWLCMILWCYEHHMLYSTKFWQGKTLANQSFQRYGGENVGELTIANVSCSNESGIWLGKILVNDVHFAKVFIFQNFVLYGSYHDCENNHIYNNEKLMQQVMFD